MGAGLKFFSPSFEHYVDLRGNVRETALADLVFDKREPNSASSGPDELVFSQYLGGY